jgi:acetolactate synthase I/III small subunit
MASIFALRIRAIPKPSSRLFHTTPSIANDGVKLPRPPRPIDDSTSALDYKRSHRHRPPPLPAMDAPRIRTAEEAVTNILYNTPPPSLQPFKKCVYHKPTPMLIKIIETYLYVPGTP